MTSIYFDPNTTPISRIKELVGPVAFSYGEGSSIIFRTEDGTEFAVSPGQWITLEVDGTITVSDSPSDIQDLAHRLIHRNGIPEFERDFNVTPSDEVERRIPDEDSRAFAITLAQAAYQLGSAAGERTGRPQGLIDFAVEQEKLADSAHNDANPTAFWIHRSIADAARDAARRQSA